MSAPDNSAIAARMEQDWDARARESAEFYIATANQHWSSEDFFRSGETNVDNDILADPELLSRGKKLDRMRILEIGCGAGRMTRAIAKAFREVHAVDISAEMIELAKRNLAALPNVVLHKNNGIDLSGLPSGSCDFAFSFIVFQHIPSREVIESYVREVHRCLKPGGIFKFQVQGSSTVPSAHADSWVGVPMSIEDARALAARCGFDLLRSSGEGSQYFWLWFQRPRWPWVPRPFRFAALALRQISVRQAALTFSVQSVRPGETYRVCIPNFPDQTIDIEYEFSPTQGATAISGVVSRWCELDSQGEALIPVPATHPAGRVRITGVRSRTQRSRWFRTDSLIEVADAPSPTAC